MTVTIPEPLRVKLQVLADSHDRDIESEAIALLEERVGTLSKTPPSGVRNADPPRAGAWEKFNALPPIEDFMLERDQGEVEDRGPLFP